MSMTAKAFLKMTSWNLVSAAMVFLPVFFAAHILIGVLLGVPVLDKGWAYQASGFVVLYLLLLTGPVAVGVLGHSMASSLCLTVLPVRGLRMAVLLLSPWVPLSPIALGLRASIVFSEFSLATAIATLTYGVATAALISRTGVLGSGRDALTRQAERQANSGPHWSGARR